MHPLQQQYVDACRVEAEVVEGLGVAHRARVDAFRALKSAAGARAEELEPLIGSRRVDGLVEARMRAIGLEPILAARTGNVVDAEHVDAALVKQIERCVPASSDAA